MKEQTTTFFAVIRDFHSKNNVPESKHINGKYFINDSAILSRRNTTEILNFA